MRNNIYTNISLPTIIKHILCIAILVLPFSSFSQSDSLLVKTDTISVDSLKSPDALDSKVIYKAIDSIRFDVKNKMTYLYGKAEVYYENIELKAEIIELNFSENLVTARGMQDSLGDFYGEPVFKEGSQQFDAHEIKYNFDTKKGVITDVMTNEGESYIHGHKIYKSESDILYIKNGKYTTCNKKEPHFHFNARKLKIIPDDKIVTGPANLWIEGIPTPLAIPFGFFPNSKKAKSGIIIPEPGESTQYGLFLLNGGYYWSISDKINMQFTGDFYSKGSWGGKFNSNYKNRYRYNGNVNLTFSTFKNGFEEFNNYAEKQDFFFRWKHDQDPKARPNSIFSANVNAGSSTNFTNNLNSSGTDYLSANFNSSISYRKSFTGKPFNFSINGFHDQNSITKKVTIRLPEAAFNVSRLYPFKRKSGKRGVLDNLGISYSMNTKNQISVQSESINTEGLSNLTDSMQNGMKHNIPISTSMKVFKHFSLNPAFNYSETWYIESINKTWNADSNRLETNDVGGFVRGNAYNMSLNLTTKLYGMYQFKGKRIKALRHVITPSVGFSYIPENRSGLKQYADANDSLIDYSIFEGRIYGSTNTSEAGFLNLSLINNFEMKVRSKKDTANPIKKIKLIENLKFSTSYNTMADSLNWSNITIGARTTLFKKITININGSLDPYALDSAGIKINKSYWETEGGLGRLTSANAALGFRLKAKTKEKKKKTSEFATEEELEYINANPQAYIDFNIPWSLNMNYNVRYAKPAFNDSETITQTLNFTGDVSLTENWKIGFTSGYDFQNDDFTYTTVDIYRDLHCWEMRFNWVPFGPRQSYLFTLKVKSSVLQDLKLTRRNLPDVF